jgi:hypothetical protein
VPALEIDFITGSTRRYRSVLAATGPRWWSPTATEDALVRAFRRLREAGERWAQLRSAEALRGTWTQ